MTWSLYFLGYVMFSGAILLALFSVVCAYFLSLRQVYFVRFLLNSA